MLGATSSNKSYGRGRAGVGSDAIFERKPSKDPFLFDSDGEPSPVKSKPELSKKHSKVKSHTNSLKVPTKKPDRKLSARGKSKDLKSVDSHENTVSERCNLRPRSSSGDSQSSYPSMQITSMTVYQSDNVDSDGKESDFENTEPVMTVSSETVRISEDNFSAQCDTRLRNQSVSDQRSYSPTKSQQNTVSEVPTINSISTSNGESERLKRFLQMDRTRLHSSSESSANNDSVEEYVARQPLVESDRLKQFLGSTKSKPRTPSVSSCDSYNDIEMDNDNRISINGSSTQHETGRFRTFLESDEDELAPANRTVKSIRLQQKERSKTSKKTNRVGRAKTHQKEKYSKLVESDRLKKFLETNSGEKSSSLSSDCESSCSDALNKTLVPHDGPCESKRLQEFLSTTGTSNHIVSEPESEDSDSVSYKPVESNRLKSFLQSDDSGVLSKKAEQNKLTSIRSVSNRLGEQSDSISRHSGLSQEMDDISIDKSKPSPPKKALLNDHFILDSDSDDNRSVPVSCLRKKTVTKQCPDNGTIKPVINFEKMEGKKEKTVIRPVRKLLGTPTKSPVKYRYNHRAWLDEQNDDDLDPDVSKSRRHHRQNPLKHPLGLKKVTIYPEKLGEKISTRIKVRPDHKALYTVVRNVRQAHECQDHGENQQIDDDLEFLLEGLEPRGPISGRYLSAVSLAKKCTNATFRMHLRSHSSLSKIFTSLSDAPSDPRLALSATAIMFMLCQDRLNMDLDRESLKLMVDLLEYDDRAHLDNKQDIADYNKSIDTVYDLYRSAIPDGEELLEKADLSPGYLAMECLLVLTSRRSGDWFKEELREAGAIVCIADSIIAKTVIVMSADYENELSSHVLTHIKKICRGLRVLEHVTAYNAGNQQLIIGHRGGEFVRSLSRLLMFGVEAIELHSIDNTSLPSSAGHLILQLLLGVLRVLVNVTHDSEAGCATVNSFSGVIEVLIKCILQSSQHVLEEQRFDLLVLGIGLSINMCEHSADSRQTLFFTETQSSYDSICEQESLTAVEALLLLFTQRLRAAEKIEAETGNLEESDITQAVGEDASESITEVLHKAGRHMEDTIVASYIALLIGVIVQHNPDYIDTIKRLLKDNSFDEIISVLQKFLSFMKMADAASGNTGSKSIGTVIGYLKECT
ncbi:wings apart-like protein homolog [Watersipora subatra]|uniref:wings apart-like protein homolog n=1 Tax=Watersipora subatra TaxID=2589382 RepID=UPI00355BA85B